MAEAFRRHVVDNALQVYDAYLPEGNTANQRQYVSGEHGVVPAQRPGRDLDPLDTQPITRELLEAGLIGLREYGALKDLSRRGGQLGRHLPACFPCKGLADRLSVRSVPKQCLSHPSAVWLLIYAALAVSTAGFLFCFSRC
ncbi:hypothetical protein SDC9_42780 [bioreactor metagenome]|uniref:Uncharacterized protein n=1 Tax=bioreactor metagenome TaxID=1076179 RepID=A0A644VZ04_9ZZZZ